MTDLIRAAQNEFAGLKQNYNDFCKEELNPWILSRPTASSLIAVAAISGAVAAVLTMGPVGLAVAIPLLLVAAKVVQVAGRNSDVFNKMWKLEWTMTKDTEGLKEAGVEGNGVEYLQSQKTPNLPMVLLLAGMPSLQANAFREQYMNQFLAEESAEDVGEHVGDAFSHAIHGRGGAALSSLQAAGSSSQKAVASSTKVVGNRLSRMLHLGGSRRRAESDSSDDERDLTYSPVHRRRGRVDQVAVVAAKERAAARSRRERR